MPELPEVTTICRILDEEVKDKTIKDVAIYRKKNILNEPNFFIDTLKGKTIECVTRIGKYIIFYLSEAGVLISHLRMEGKYFYDKKYSERKHDIVTFYFTDGTALTYNDTRKFGILKVSNLDKYRWEPPLYGLALDPLQITQSDYLYFKFEKLHKPIKEVLLDQSVVSGIGNIYADEILFASKIHPLTLASNLVRLESDDLLEYAKRVLVQAIDDGGSTIKSYHPKDGISGNFQTKLKVYDKEGQPCPCCQTPLRKIRVGGRGTTFCPNCQRRKEKRIIAITGAIASGKSSVSNYLNKKGFIIYDGDKTTHELYKNPLFIEKLKKIVPKLEIIDNAVDRKKLLDIMTNNQSIKESVEQLVYDEVRKLAKDTIDKYHNGETIVLDIPLLFASKIDEYADEIYIVRTSKENQINRLAIRNGNIETYLKLNESYQKQEKINKATAIIHNDGDLSSLYKQIDKIICREKHR